MSKIWNKIYLFLVFIFLYAPIFVLIIFSFNEGKTRGSWDGFSLEWYRLLLEDQEILSAIGNTFLVAIITTVVSTIIGTLGAIGISSYGRKFRTIILGLNQIPVINPDIVMAVGLMVLFRTLNMEFGLFTLTLAHIAFTIPYVVLSVLPKLRQMPPSIVEAAMDLGATPQQTLSRVVLPYIKTGIMAGALMALTLSLDDFVISFFTTGNGVETISTMVYSMARRGINPEINALSTIMFTAMLLFLVIMNIMSFREERKIKKENRKNA